MNKIFLIVELQSFVYSKLKWGRGKTEGRKLKEII